MTASTVVSVAFNSQERHYNIYIGHGLLSQLSSYLETSLASRPQKILVVSDSSVWPLYSQQVLEALKKLGSIVETVIIPAGEASKTLATATQVFDVALKVGLSRRDLMIAVGGGVVGDLTGFCAATYYRGMPFVQIPTTLLAQVDSSVGGKVAVNYQDVKNGIGAFYQPALVLIDLDLLKTLPRREMLAGLAEVVKYGLIEHTALGAENSFSNSFFNFLEAHANDWETGLESIVERCCQIKAIVVKRDETEQLSHTASGRVCLNLGHTYAHAYEAITDYQQFLHGEAVSIGIMYAFETAVLLNLISAQEKKRVLTLFKQLQLPVASALPFPSEGLIRLMRKDKKASHSQLMLVLPKESIGTVTLVPNTPEEAVQRVLEKRPE